MKRTTRLIALIVALLLALPMAAFAEGSPVVYRELYASEVDTLNYLYTTTTNNLTIPANVVDTLIEYDRYGVLQPSLAESWEHNEDYTEWTFHIRQGVKFSNGNDMTPETVKASIERTAEQNSRGGNLMLDSIEVDGEYVIFKTTEPYSAFPYYLTEPMCIIVDTTVPILSERRNDPPGR